MEEASHHFYVVHLDEHMQRRYLMSILTIGNIPWYELPSSIQVYTGQTQDYWDQVEILLSEGIHQRCKTISLAIVVGTKSIFDKVYY